MSGVETTTYSMSLDHILQAFATAQELSDPALAEWLEMAPDLLPELRTLTTPAPFSETYLQDCMAIVDATGCSAWALEAMLLWTMGKR
jgi:hypothetical protein